jgi:hypothetical protein
MLKYRLVIPLLDKLKTRLIYGHSVLCLEVIVAVLYPNHEPQIRKGLFRFGIYRELPLAPAQARRAD